MFNDVCSTYLSACKEGGLNVYLDPGDCGGSLRQSASIGGSSAAAHRFLLQLSTVCEYWQQLSPSTFVGSNKVDCRVLIAAELISIDSGSHRSFFFSSLKRHYCLSTPKYFLRIFCLMLLDV